MSDMETTTTIKLENVCPHGFWVGYGAAPCPFCYPECYQNVPCGPGPTDYGRKVGMTEAGELRLTLASTQARLSEAERERDEALERAERLDVQLQDIQSDYGALDAERDELRAEVARLRAIQDAVEALPMDEYVAAYDLALDIRAALAGEE